MTQAVKCLLVDDLPENLLALSALMKSPDVELLQARSGREALELLLVHEVALAIVDVQMPEMDGFELAELMRGSERTRHTPLIFVTAGSHDERWQFRGYNSGAVDFLYKPVSPILLRSKSEVFFDLYRSKKEVARQLEERTETLRLYELFAAILGHDLRTPLSAILMSASYLKRSSDVEGMRKAADRVVQSGERMNRMIQDMLDLTRARLMGGIAIEPQTVDAGQLVRRVVEEHLAAHASRDIRVLESGDLTAQWDDGRVAQLAANLIGNACEHGTGGAIDVALDGRDANCIVLTVENDGAVPADAMPHLFDPFHARKRRGGRSQNLGLGLYIAKRIAEAHSGTLTADASQSERARFVATLPRAPLHTR